MRDGILELKNELGQIASLGTGLVGELPPITTYPPRDIEKTVECPICHRRCLIYGWKLPPDRPDYAQGVPAKSYLGHEVYREPGHYCMVVKCEEVPMPNGAYPPPWYVGLLHFFESDYITLPATGLVVGGIVYLVMRSKK